MNDSPAPPRRRSPLSADWLALLVAVALAAAVRAGLIAQVPW